MRNILKANIIMLIAALFFTACEKGETPEVFDTISGILSAGENVNTEDLNGLKVYLGRFHDSVDLSSITLKTTAIDSVGVTTLNADGSFTFSGLSTGNYGLVLEDGFIITGDTALTFQFNALEQQKITQTIDRIPQNNAQMAGYGTIPTLTFKRDNLSSKYTIKKLKCYNDTKLHSSCDVSEFSNNSTFNVTLATILLAGNITFELEFSTVDTAGKETNTFTPKPITYYKSGVDNTNEECLSTPLLIKWVVKSETKTTTSGWLCWKKTTTSTVYSGYYSLSDN